MTEPHFPVLLSLRIDWSELDYFSHVNNVSFFKYIQAARVNYWEQIGLTASHKQTNTGAMLVSCKCDFKKPLFYPGNVFIRSRVSFIKSTSFGISHQLLNDKNEIVALAEDIMVIFDFNDNRKVVFPDTLRMKIMELETKNIQQ